MVTPREEWYLSKGEVPSRGLLTEAGMRDLDWAAADGPWYPRIHWTNTLLCYATSRSRPLPLIS